MVGHGITIFRIVTFRILRQNKMMEKQELQRRICCLKCDELRSSHHAENLTLYSCVVSIFYDILISDHTKASVLVLTETFIKLQALWGVTLCQLIVIDICMTVLSPNLGSGSTNPIREHLNLQPTPDSVVQFVQFIQPDASTSEREKKSSFSFETRNCMTVCTAFSLWTLSWDSCNHFTSLYLFI